MHASNLSNKSQSPNARDEVCVTSQSSLQVTLVAITISQKNYPPDATTKLFYCVFFPQQTKMGQTR